MDPTTLNKVSASGRIFQAGIRKIVEIETEKRGERKTESIEW